MPDGVDINWGLLGKQPDFTAGVAQAFNAGRDMAQQKRGDEALARVQANPDDPAALSTLALYNPQAANAFMTTQNMQRAAKARTATSGVFSAYGGGGNALAPVPAPLPATGMPAPAPMGAPQALPSPVGGQPAPAQAGAPQPPPAAPPAPGTVSPTDLLQPSHPVTQQVGAAVASGQMPLAQAVAEMAKYADPEQLAQTINAVAQMDQIRRTKLAESSEALGSEAVALKNVPVAQRQQVALHALPQLEQHGITREMIMSADLSDAGLNGLIGQAIGTKAILDQANTVVTQQQGQQRIGIEQQQATETARHDRESERLAGFKDVPFGQSIVDVGGGGGGTQYTGGWTPRARNGGDNSDASVDNKITAAARMLGVAPGGDISHIDPLKIAQAMTAGEGPMRGNNPTNLRVPGQSGFQQFGSQQAGLEAAAAQVRRNLARGQTTVTSMIEGLPAKGGNGGARVVYDGGGGVEAMASNAKLIADYQMAPPTGRAAYTPQGQAVMQQVLALNPTFDGTRFGERSKAVKDWGSGKLGTALRSMNTAYDHIGTLQVAAQALQNGNTPMFNRLANSIATATGHAAPGNFDALRAFVADEVTKGIIGTAGGVGDRAEAARVISSASSPEQLAGILYGWKHLLAGQLRSQQQQYMDDTGFNVDRFKAKLSPRVRAEMGFDTAQTQGQTPEDIAKILHKYGVQ